MFVTMRTLLHSDTNSKSEARRLSGGAGLSASKSKDLNHMIQHSLNKLNQVTENIA